MAELTAAATAYLYALAAALGLCMGSFLNCFAYRYVHGGSAAKGRSQCALCGHSLGAADLVPLVSWLLLGGKCRYCGKKISAAYPLAELVCALAYLSVAARFGISILLDFPGAARYFVLFSLLFAAALTDLYGGLIPDRVIIVGAACALGYAVFWPQGPVGASVLRTLGGGLSVSAPLLALTLVFERISGRESMGGGDIKLMFMIGLYFDWKLNILILIAACVLGIAFALAVRPTGDAHGRRGAFSFGPALALSAWLASMWGGRALDWYLGFFI